LAETREELSRADTKASILLSALAVVTGVLLNAIAAGNWSPGRFSVALAQGLWWIGIAVGILSGLSLVTAIWPRTKHPNSAAVEYFGHVSRFHRSRLGRREERLKDYYDAVALACSDPVRRRLGQIWVLSKLLHLKYTAIRWALVLAGLSIVCVGASFIAERVIATVPFRP
jgi:hypothetical protein